MTRRVKRESLIQGEITDYLDARGDVFGWRHNTGAAVFRTRAGKKRLVRYGKPGSADWIGVWYPGRPLAVETKTAIGKLDPDQVRFCADWVKAGGIYILARSVVELEHQMGPPLTRIILPPKRVFRGATPDPRPEPDPSVWGR